MSDLVYEAARAAHARMELSTTMMSRPLRVTDVMRRAETLFADVEIVSRVAKGRIERTTYAAVAGEARRLAGALRALGVKPGQRVATLMWNHASHLTTYYAVPAIDAVLHPVNVRLSAEEIAYILSQAGDEVVIVDHDLLPLYEEVEKFVRVPHVIVRHLEAGTTVDGRHDWHALLAAASPLDTWPDGPFDENRAVSVCYTSGTSGRPKGVVYSHRSTLLHGFAASATDNFNISGRDTLLPLTPLFHVNGWSLPYSAAMFGAKLVFSGPHAHGEDVLDLMTSERVTAAFGVPTFWADALKVLQAHPARWKLEAGTRIYAGGAAPSIDMIKRFDAMGVYLQTGWGMTECSPIGSQTWIKRSYDDRSEDERIAVRTSNGIALPFVEVRHVDAVGEVLPWDGVSRGELQVRGPWVTQGYLGFPDTTPATSDDGWLQTGDVVTIASDGYIRLVDRIKDLVKSGGEWISSADMEQKLLEISGVSEAAVIGILDDRWGERPLALIALRDGADLDQTRILGHLASHYPKWMVPDKVVILDELPHTSIGKLDKMKLRKQFGK
jgi:fatty-acyl-CoA synthase